MRSLDPASRTFSHHDAELLAVVVVWGLNLTVAKFGLAEMSPLAFNGVRFWAATLALLAVLLVRGGGLGTGLADGARIALLGLVGHGVYQIFFIEGLARTTATHSALIFGSTPILVALLSQLLGHERIRPAMWGGSLLGFGGVYVVIAGMPPAGGPAPSLEGDLLIMAATLCWALYTTLSRSVLSRHSALKVTTLTMIWGSLFLAPLSAAAVADEGWLEVSARGWAAMGYGILFPLVFAYLVWYRAIRAVGSVRTSIYSNLVPVTGALAGWLMLDERLYPAVGVGAVAIFGGIFLTARASRGSSSGGADDSAPAPGAAPTDSGPGVD